MKHFSEAKLKKMSMEDVFHLLEAPIDGQYTYFERTATTVPFQRSLNLRKQDAAMHPFLKSLNDCHWTERDGSDLKISELAWFVYLNYEKEFIQFKSFKRWVIGEETSGGPDGC